MNQERARVEWLDLVRTVAIVLVVFCHATESVYKLTLENMLSLSFQSRVFGFACFSAGRLGVPLFLMITGSLLLSRDYDNNSVKYFWKNKWLHLLICTIIWFFIYDVFLVLHNHASISALQLLEELLFLRNIGISHAWYLPAILGLYILLPFVASVLKKYDNAIFVFPLLIYTFYSLGYSTFRIVYDVYFPEMPLSNQFSLGFSGEYFGLYILYGYFISTGSFKRIHPFCIAFISVSAFASVVYLQCWLYQNGYQYNVWYNNLLLLVASMGIYELASRIKHICGYGLIRRISYYSFGIYLTHKIFISVFANRVKGLAVMMPVKLVLLWTLGFAFSFVITVLMSRIPKVGKYLLYMK